MKKHMLCCAAAASLMIASALAVPASAASNATVEDNSTGNYSYVAMLNKIYRVNMKTRKYKKIKTFKGVTDIDYISCKKGWLYFSVNRYKGSDKNCDSIYRMKTSGKSAKKLATGSHPIVMGSKIYYMPAVKHGKGGSAYTTGVGISRMSLSGKSKKRLMSSTRISDIACASNRIRYTTYDDIYVVNSLSTSGAALKGNIRWTGNSPIIYSNTNKLLLAYPETTYLQTFTDGKSTICKINGHGYLSSPRSIGFVGNYGFYRTSSINLKAKKSSGTLYMFTAKKGAAGKKVKHITNGFPLEVLAVNKGTIVFLQTYKTTNKYAVSIVRTSGKGYKMISKYYHW